MTTEAYKVRAVVEPGTVIEHDRMGRFELAAHLEGFSRRLIGSEATVISLLTVSPVSAGPDG